VPLLLWEGYTGARALQLIHSLVWEETPPRIRPLRSSLAFSGGMCVFVATVMLTWWLRDWTQLGQLGLMVLMVAPLAGLWLAVSLRLPHGSARWPALLPAAILVAIGFQVTHGCDQLRRLPRLATGCGSPLSCKQRGGDPELGVLQLLLAAALRAWAPVATAAGASLADRGSILLAALAARAGALTLQRS
jgi:hypothetical protein